MKYPVDHNVLVKKFQLLGRSGNIFNWLIIFFIGSVQGVFSIVKLMIYSLRKKINILLKI